MFYPEFTVTQKTLKNIGTVEYSRAIADSVKILPAWEKQLQKEALTSRIYSLLKIEGTGIDEQIIKASLEGFTDNKPQEVINFDAALKSVKEIGKKLELEEIDIKYINQTLTQRLMPKTKQGAYRTLKKTGKPDPGEILAKIVTLFDWLNSLDARENHPLITASILSAEILRLEPFENFNNSTASLAFDLVLESYGYSLGGLIEIDSYFLSSRKEFEEALTEIEKNNFDYTHWLEYVTHGISVKTYNLVEKIKLLEKDTKVAKATGRVKVTERQERIIEYLQDYGLLQNKDFPTVFPDISEDTVLRDLKSLLDRGIIKKTGSTKSSRYELS
ncbi:hypothetical protein A2380_04010 [candidate division WWE3 bacterium RIFOXYB1_FULL_43_24]|uniref:Fido domain-containing protein n=2 Tax=Katanobacteria TaxID=422282 RepID=A0A0G1ASH8_UNCKA|nr:MAG: hypothetical protein UU92_C0014G0010 [candidate division WWE3 bacterium GW2011_GWA1_42_12]KKS37046.1 MAG: hypothetical protein UV00_C0018G0010 [candidate division WWE3 bacterium GW2011_GWF1_42_14]KKS40028.1 MAG: hypothetical protein UV03_C0014G0010 [candidate division WWE3 bacterium GW2011_GWE1_42_16]KKS66698.1 MAG: hypothetical protein UV35_C0009G0010 [candidate division WWE3 bacterium GW2011_GWB1_42_6]OGC60067.1 MAG: hypothetical protein A2212_02195 [candidate division WWE3 bacterium 